MCVVAALAASCHSDPPVGPTVGHAARPTPRAAGAIVPTPIPPAVPTVTPAPTPAAGATATPTATARATATATATATASPTAAPTATPLPDGPTQPGPVASATFRFFSARPRDGNVFRDPVQDAQGNQIVYFDEIVIFDVTPRNAANQPCEAQGEPEYIIEDNGGLSGALYLQPLASNNPFLLRVQVIGRTGAAKPVHLYARIDGKTSNHLWVVAR